MAEEETIETVETKSVLDTVASSPWARTLWQGFIVDALAAIGLGLTTLLATGDLTSPAFWSAVGLLVGKSVLTSIASWLTRLKPAA
ncbi:MAG TPA: hypothetical protein VLJ40_10145 [Arthrobacter sp.]|nr:hypothetical protein [Arthrobacter sp.]